MEDLKNEIATLQKGMEAMTTVIDAYVKSIEILSLKLEEFQDRKIDISETTISNRILTFMAAHLPYTTEMEFNDGGFSATLELGVHELVSDNLPFKWELDLAKEIINDIQDTNK
jgi:hypothetical protein